MIKITGLGGFREVGRSAIHLETEKERFLFDFGIEVQDGKVPLSHSPGWIPKLDGVFLSHVHLDHSGHIPWLYKNGYTKNVFATKTTFDLSSILLRDSVKVQEKKGEIPKFLNSDIVAMEKLEKKLNYGKGVEIGESVIEFADAGHVPGSAVTILENNGKRILYTGDIKFIDTDLVKGAGMDFKDIDVVICESTYPFKDHPSRKELAEKLREKIRHTYSSGGITILPCFAVGRTQEMMVITEDLGIPVYLDGMGISASRIILSNPESLRYPEKLKKAFNNAHKVGNAGKRNKAIRNPCIIITTAGMLNGGPVNFYIKKLYKRQDCSLILTGFQCEKTVGRTLMDSGRYVNEGMDVKPSFSTDFMDFSVLPSTPVLVNSNKGMEISLIKDVENAKHKTFAFDKNTLKCRWYPIEKILKHPYNGEIYKITTKSGRSVEVTKGHSLFVLKKGKVLDIPGDKIEPGDYVLVPKIVYRSPSAKMIEHIDVQKFIKRENARIPEKIKITPQLCRLLGYYAAEGHAIDRVVISIGKKEKELEKDIKNCIRKTFPNYLPSIYSPHETEYQIKFGSFILSRIFKELCGKDSKNKKIPSFIFSSSNKNIGNFIGAYLEGDGWWDKAHLRVKSVSKKLILDLMYLLLQIGITAKYDGIQIAKKRKTKKGTIFKESKSYVLRIQGINDLKKILHYLRPRLRKRVSKYLQQVNKTMTYPPLALPIKETGLNKIKFKNKILNWYIRNSLKSKRNHIDPEKLKKEPVTDFIKKILTGDVAFDVVTNVEKRNYSGFVYDFSVPKVQNFIGGFGGIFLHNSAHTDRSHLLEFFEKTNPEKIILVHGDSNPKFAEELKSKGFNAIAPENMETVKI